METNNQQRIDASRTAAFIEKNAERYYRNLNFAWMVNTTVYLTSDEIHESMRVVGGDLFKGQN